MQYPFFYINEYATSQTDILLEEETSRHVIQVLRMKKGDKLHLTDGRGHLITATVLEEHKKHCTVRVGDVQFVPGPDRPAMVGISLLKNTSRFEWFLEKATELGVSELIPMLCTRTEKQSFRPDRMKNILVSAMLQSQQVWLPVLHAPIDYSLLFRQQEVADAANKFIAHCMEGEKTNLSVAADASTGSRLILIGPEGDFTAAEANLALQNHFIPVSLGDTRLRAETAGMVAATLLCLV
ncbi:MAG: RsmE family RNA methyltransferase [Chitinophagaceae bacterium]